MQKVMRKGKKYLYKVISNSIRKSKCVKNIFPITFLCVKKKTVSFTSNKKKLKSDLPSTKDKCSPI